MLVIRVQDNDLWDDAKQEFTSKTVATLELEHSLVSLSKWESIFEKPFLGDGEKSDEEVLAYVETMILSGDFSPEVISKLSQENMDEINTYINASKTATWFSSESAGRTGEVITSELIYYWMIAFNIPFECQYWHLNRLFTLIRVCNIKNTKPKKMSRSEMAAQRRKLNAERQQKFNTTG